LASNESDPLKLDPKMNEMMKKTEAACTPGPAHRVLDPLVGDWESSQDADGVRRPAHRDQRHREMHLAEGLD